MPVTPAGQVGPEQDSHEKQAASPFHDSHKPSHSYGPASKSGRPER